MSQDIHSYIDTNQGRFQAELFDFLRIPSVSARTEHNADVARTADWVAERARELGMAVQVHKTKGHPIVVARHEKAGQEVAGGSTITGSSGRNLRSPGSDRFGSLG